MARIKETLKSAGSGIASAAKKLKFKDWLLILVALLAIAFGITSRYYKNRAYEAELASITDTLHVYQNKLNEEYLARNISIQTEKDLKKLNSDLADELKSLKEHPLVITKTKVEFRVDTVYAQSDSIVNVPDSAQHRLYWHYDNPSGHFFVGGNTTVMTDFSNFSTQITNLRIPASLTLDVIEQKNGTIKIIGKSDNPYVSLTDIDGVVLDPTQSKVVKSYFGRKRWNIGPMVGFGLTSDLKFRPYVGIGITYGIISF